MPEQKAPPEQPRPSSANLPPAERCAENAVQNNVLMRMREWLATELPNFVATPAQRGVYATSVSGAKVDPNPPTTTAEDHLSERAIFCTLTFSATVLDPTPTLGSIVGNRYPIEIKSVPYVWDDGVYLDLPPKGYTFATLTPYQKRLVNSFYYRGFPISPDPAIRAKAAEELKKRLASAPQQPRNAIEGYQAMFGAAATETNQILRAKGLGKYVDAAKKPLTPAQRADLNRRIKACENAGGTWGTPMMRNSFMPAGREGCYFMNLHR